MDAEHYFDTIFKLLKESLGQRQDELPSVSLIARENTDPYRVLISTVISLRTKDEVTLAASRRLFSLAATPFQMVTVDQGQIEQAIYPAGFYHRKAKDILAISRILIREYDGKVPPDATLLQKLPGVGIKTANLTLNLGFGIDAICVDTHVHRIANRFGWISTKSPEQSEKALQECMPKRFWIPLNELLVSYGQKICTPISPRCSLCKAFDLCPRVGVKSSR